MKQAELIRVINSIKKIHTPKLQKIIQVLGDWESNHRKCKNSYFWTPPTSASQRRGREQYYTFDATCKVGIITLEYWSDCTVSCRYFYWRDGLSITNDENMNVNFRDIKNIIVSIEDILEQRQRKADGKATKGSGND